MYKIIISFKRKPQNIALIFLTLAFLVFSMNLHNFSNATFKVSGDRNFMGISEFAIFLLSILSFVCLLNSYPNRMPTKIPMLILTFVLMFVVLGCDVIYFKAVINALKYHNSGEFPLDKYYVYVNNARVVLIWHMILQVIAIIMLALRNVIGKLFRMIRANVEIEENQNMHEIKISNE